jgi:hypothetical protein
MCKGCDMTREIERLYREHGILNGELQGGMSSTSEDFDAAINAPINILAHIAATWFSDRSSRHAFLNAIGKSLEKQTKARVAGEDTMH